MKCKDIYPDNRWYQYKIDYTIAIGLRSKKDFFNYKDILQNFQKNQNNSKIKTPSISSLNSIVNSVLHSTNDSVDEVLDENVCVMFDNTIEVHFLTNFWNLKEAAMKRSPVTYLQI